VITPNTAWSAATGKACSTGRRGLATVLFLGTLLALTAGVARAQTQGEEEFRDFAHVANLQLVGQAAASRDDAGRPVLRLTPARRDQLGSAWHRWRLQTLGGFTTTFTFRITGRGNEVGAFWTDANGNPLGGDGFSFNVQNYSPACTANESGLTEVRYPPNNGQPQKLSVKFDTFNNGPEWGEASNNFVQVGYNGQWGRPVNLDPSVINMADGNVHRAKIRLQVDGTLTVAVDGHVVLTETGINPTILSWSYVGFGARTMAAWENHDILSWSFSSQPLANRRVVSVSPWGNDANDGSWGAPKRTLEASLEGLQPGDVVFMAHGTYPNTHAIVPAGVEIVGNGAVLDGGGTGTVLTLAGATTPDQVGQTPSQFVHSLTVQDGATGVDVSGTTALLWNLTIQRNRGGRTGGITGRYARPSILSSRIVNNSGQDNGGIGLRDSEPHIAWSTISGNTGTGDTGGLNLSRARGAIVVHQNGIHNNSGNAYNGIASWTWKEGAETEAPGCALWLTGNSIEWNRYASLNYYNPIIEVASARSFHIEGNIIRSNAGRGRCFALWNLNFPHARGVLARNVFDANGFQDTHPESGSKQPTVYLNNIADLKVYSNHWSQNWTAAISSGIWLTRCQGKIINNSFVGNHGLAGDIVADNSSLTIANNLLVGSPRGGGLQQLNGGTVGLSHNKVVGNVHNYRGIDPGASDLSPESPIVDTGDNSLVEEGWTDIYGRARILNGIVDVGSWEDPSPRLVNDEYAMDEDEPLTVAAPGVLANDRDPLGGALTARVSGPPAHGTLTLNEDGSFVYTPNRDYNGEDTFTYTASNGSGYAWATVTLTVRPVNDAPVANDDSATLEKNGSVIVSPLTNDTDVDDPKTSLTLDPTWVKAPSNGKASRNADNTVTYEPKPGFTGTDTFTYTARDPAGATDTATVTVTVTSKNRAPTAQADSYAYTLPLDDIGKTITRTLPVLANDSDPDGDALRIITVSPSRAGATITTDGATITYRVTAEGTVSDTFTYTISDGHDNTATGEVTLRVSFRRMGKQLP
jgi:VCBS repeat-containing protein